VNKGYPYYPYWLDLHAPDSDADRQRIIEAIEQRYSRGPYSQTQELDAWRDTFLALRRDGQLAVWESGGGLPLPPSVLASDLRIRYPNISERTELPPGTPPSPADRIWSAHYSLDSQRQFVFFDQLLTHLPSFAAAQFPLSRPDGAAEVELVSPRVEIDDFPPYASRAYLRATLRTRFPRGRLGDESNTTLLNFPVLSRDGTFNNRGTLMLIAVDELKKQLENTLTMSLEGLRTRFAKISVRALARVSLDELFTREA
jgi:hypothetical protein